MLSTPSKNTDTGNTAFVAQKPETLQTYALRFLLLGGAVIFLIAVVAYLYQIKVGNPVAQLEGDVETQVVTKPTALIHSRDAAPSSKIAQYMPSATSIQLRGQGVECPSGTNRMIYIDDQALCCQGTVCKEPR